MSLSKGTSVEWNTPQAKTGARAAHKASALTETAKTGKK